MVTSPNKFSRPSTRSSAIVIRDIESFDGMREVEELQKDVWQFSDLDIVPRTILVPTKEVGGVLVGAYHGSALVGFAYGFPGWENGQVTHHSHMLAVRPQYRNLDLGFKLKLAQRDRVLNQGIKRITWTFDPLQSRNAYFNFAKLGVVADSYRKNFYGATSSSFLHQAGTDRLWVTWLIDSERVRGRLENENRSKASPVGAVQLLRVGVNLSPESKAQSDSLNQDELAIDIPTNVGALQVEKPDLVVEWRKATRHAFVEAMTRGYVVEEFYRSQDGDKSAGRYLLRHIQTAARVTDLEDTAALV
jgi:predicted GNAT superfamily acetyltransferase